jgi:probable HAF family extracellular repeat protein
MRTHKLTLFVLGFVLVFTVAAANAANPPKLTFKVVTTNVPGAVDTYPWDINNAGVTVGQYVDSNFITHGYILNGKQLTTLDDPKGLNTLASGIQYNGSTVVGEYQNTSTSNSMGFLYINGTFTDIPGPAGAVSSGAYGINDKGAIVGYYTDSSGNMHGFLLQETTYMTLDVPGATGSSANDINNSGYIVLAWINSSGGYAGSVYNPKTQKYKTIKVPGAGTLGSYPNYINNQGDITFVWYEGIFFLTQSALFHDGKFYKSDPTKHYQTQADGINDENTFVGFYQQTNNGNWSGFTGTFQ